MLNDFQPAMEVSTEELLNIIGGRKELFNKFYPQIVEAMSGAGTSKLMRAVASYRDANINILSSPYILDYTIFSTSNQNIIWDITRLDEVDVAAEIKALKKDIKEGCKLKGYKAPASLFVNITPFRVAMLLIMRFFIERGKKKELSEACAYMGYSMFFTLFHNSFPYGVKKEIMIYTMTNLTNKHKLKTVGSVDNLLTYGVQLCTDRYTQRIMECTDHDIVYVIDQFKSRIRGYFVGIANKYHPNAEKKEAIFISSEQLSDGEGGSDFIERGSRSGNVEQLAQQYTNRFFQKPIDEQVLQICSKMNQVSRSELKNAVTALRSDNGRIPEVKDFYNGIFYLYFETDNADVPDIHSKKFLSVMDGVYKKGNSKEKNITNVKRLLDTWLTAVSPTYREVTRTATINNFRKALYQYFIFTVTLRK